MIKDKIHKEMIVQKHTQTSLVRSVNNLNKNNKLTQPQLSNFLLGKMGLSVNYIEAMFEVLNIKLIKIL